MDIETLTPDEAWAGFVGDQSRQEFMEISATEGYVTAQDAVRAYVAVEPCRSAVADAGLDAEDVADLLVAHLVERRDLWCIVCDRAGQATLGTETVTSICRQCGDTYTAVYCAECAEQHRDAAAHNPEVIRCAECLGVGR